MIMSKVIYAIDLKRSTYVILLMNPKLFEKSDLSLVKSHVSILRISVWHYLHVFIENGHNRFKT